jgi:hypothetical protein
MMSKHWEHGQTAVMWDKLAANLIRELEKVRLLAPGKPRPNGKACQNQLKILVSKVKVEGGRNIPEDASTGASSLLGCFRGRVSHMRTRLFPHPPPGAPALPPLPVPSPPLPSHSFPARRTPCHHPCLEFALLRGRLAVRQSLLMFSNAAWAGGGGSTAEVDSDPDGGPDGPGTGSGGMRYKQGLKQLARAFHEFKTRSG